MTTLVQGLAAAIGAVALAVAVLAGCSAGDGLGPDEATSAQSPSAHTTVAHTPSIQSPAEGPAPSAAPSSPSANPTATPNPTGTPSPTGIAGPDLQALAERFATQVPNAWGLEVPGVVTHAGHQVVALTLDACGGAHGSGYDAALIEGLIQRGVPATLFLNQRWIQAHPDAVKQLAANPLFELANHGTHHRPLSVTGQSAYGIPGTQSAADVVAEVWENHLALTEITGTEPRYFRSGTAHYDDVSVAIVAELGEVVAGFSVNADAGATFSAAVVQSQVASARAGDVVIAHMNQPSSGTAQGLLAGVDQLLSQGVEFGFLEVAP